MYRESLFRVKKLDGGELNSFEFSECSVRSKHQNPRVIVMYRPPYSDDHKVLTATFLNEFANYIEMKVLCYINKYGVTGRRQKPPKQILLPYVVKTLTNNVELIQMLNPCGHANAYS